MLEAPSGAEAEAIAVLETAIAADHRSGKYPRVEVLGLGGAWQNLAMVRGWEAINGYNPLRIGLYDRLVAPGEENWDVSHRQFPSSFSNYGGPLARALGLTYLVLGQPLDRIPALSTPPAAELMFAGPPVWIYRLAGAMPRALFGSDDAKTSPGQLDVSSSSEKPSIVKLESLTTRSRRTGHDIRSGWSALCYMTATIPVGSPKSTASRHRSGGPISYSVRSMCRPATIASFFGSRLFRFPISKPL